MLFVWDEICVQSSYVKSMAIEYYLPYLQLLSLLSVHAYYYEPSIIVLQLEY